MMMTFTNLKSLCLAITMLAILPLSDVFSQDFINDTTGVVNNSGTLRIKSTTGKFKNGADAVTKITNTGTIEFVGNGTFTDMVDSVNGTRALGHDASWRVPGKTLWSSILANQNIQGRWYDSLLTSGAGEKEFNDDSVYIYRSYAPAGGSRDYGTSTVFYDGADAQTIFAENGTVGGLDVYYNLNLQNAGAKSIVATETVNVENNVFIEASSTEDFTISGILNSDSTFTQEALAGAVAIDATGELNLGGGASEFNGAVTVAGLLKTEGDGLATFKSTVDVNTDGTFNLAAGNALIDYGASLTLADAATAIIDLDTNKTLTVSGDFVNNHAAAVNLTFDQTSTVLYNDTIDGQSIVSTVNTNQYGNLTVEGGYKSVGGNIYMAGDFSLSDTNLVLVENTLYVTDDSASVTYGDLSREVVGKMRRTIGVPAAYTFNNTYTVVDYATLPDPGTYMELDVRPSTDPNLYDDTLDVHRKITMAFDDTLYVADITAGYKPAEVPTFGDGLAQKNLKFYEADATEQEKMTGSGPYVRDTSGLVLRSVKLPGIEGTGSAVDGIVDKYFFATNDLKLRANNQMFSIASGRWSNPNTWDEYREPLSEDNVVISSTHQVHAGGTGSGGRDTYSTAEALTGDGGDFVNSIVIQNDAALVLGGSLIYDLTALGSITNNANVAVTVNNFANFLSTAPGSYASRGLIIYEGELRANDITNKGLLWINTGATVEVGD